MQIKFFLEKFQKIVHDELYSKKLICEVLFQVVGVELHPDCVKISRGVLYIQTDSFVKNEIFLRKSKIIYTISQSLGLDVKDIR